MASKPVQQPIFADFDKIFAPCKPATAEQYKADFYWMLDSADQQLRALAGVAFILSLNQRTCFYLEMWVLK